MDNPRRKNRKIRDVPPEDFSAHPKPSREEIWLSQRIPKEAYDPHRHTSVMSYNMLAQAYTKQEYFPYAEHLYLSVRYRTTSILVEIDTFAPDIACFQEMDRYNEVWKKELLRLGYDSLWVKRSGRKRDGCGIFWNERFKLIDSHEIHLNDLSAKYGVAIERDNVALFVRLQAATGEQFCVGTVHLYWDPEVEWIKLLQARHYITELHRFANGLPVIATGDFNSQPNSAVYAEITGAKSTYTVKMPVPQPNITTDEGKAPPLKRAETGDDDGGNFLKMSDDDVKEQPTQSVEHTDLPLLLSSAYSGYSPRGHPPFTNFKVEFQGTLDYIFYDATRIEALSCLGLPTRAAILKEKALPSSTYPSDHLSIIANFAFLPKP